MESKLRAEGSLIWRMFGYLDRHKAALALGVCLSLLVVGAEVLRPYLVKVMIDDFILQEHRHTASLLGLAAVFLLVVFGGGLLQYSQQRLLQEIGQQVIFRLRQEMFDKLTRLPMRFFDRHGTGRILTRVSNDSESLHQLYANVAVSLFTQSLLFLGVLGTMLWMSPRLTLLCLALVPLLLGVSQLYRILVREARQAHRRWLSRLNAFLAENLAGMAIVQLFVRQRQQQQTFERLNQNFYRAGMRLTTLHAVYTPAIGFISNLALALLVWRGGVLALDEAVTFGVVYAFTQYTRQLFQPLNTLAERFTQVQNGLTAAERIFDLLDEAEEPRLPRGRKLPARLKGEICFEGVWFAYDERDAEQGNWVLKDISFRIRPGETVAFVGETGAGKTSIMRLLMRLYPYQKGRIKVDGVDIAEVDPLELRQHIGWVSQDLVIFPGDIRHNLLLGRQVKENVFQQVSHLMQLESVLGREGCHTRLGEGGTNLSTGERQLVAFARAVVGEPDILILDEATAHIDSQTEEVFQQALRQLSRGRTTLIIAHRLSTVTHADRIHVLHQGRIVESGTHQELLALSGRYALLYQLQSGAQQHLSMTKE